MDWCLLRPLVVTVAALQTEAMAFDPVSSDNQDRSLMTPA